MIIFDDSQKNILETIKKEALKDYVPILKDDSLSLISLILQLKKPNKILEIGSAVGYSAICFSKYLEGKNAKITTLEIDEDMYKKSLKNIALMNLQDRIEIINTDATKYLPELKEDQKYDIVFIDAAKSKYLIFLENALKQVKCGGIIIADNVLFKGMVLSDYNEHKHRTTVNKLRQFLSIIKTSKELDTYVFNIGDGVSVSIKK